MIKLYSPENEVQLAVLRSLFEAEGIPIFVHNDHFGSMETGVQIALFNRKTIMVSEKHFQRSSEIIQSFLANIAHDATSNGTPPPGYSLFDKLRMVVESLIFGWVMPGKRWPKK